MNNTEKIPRRSSKNCKWGITAEIPEGEKQRRKRVIEARKYRRERRKSRDSMGDRLRCGIELILTGLILGWLRRRPA